MVVARKAKAPVTREKIEADAKAISDSVERFVDFFAGPKKSARWVDARSPSTALYPDSAVAEAFRQDKAHAPPVVVSGGERGIWQRLSSGIVFERHLHGDW